MSNVPKQVREQAEAAEAMFNKIVGNTESATQNVSNSDSSEVSKDVNANVSTEVSSDVNSNVSTDVSNKNEQDVSANVEQNVIPQNEATNWQERAEKAESRYKVLQGKYNKEIAELKQNQNNAELQTLRQQVSDLQQTISELRESPKPAAANIQSASLDELREDYGADLIDGVINAVKGELSGEFQQIKQSVQNESATTKQTLLEQRLATSGINFQQTDSDPLFHDWLGKFDSETGIQRQRALEAAFNSGDLAATAQFYIDFLGHNSAPQQTTQSMSFEQHVQAPSTAPVQPAPAQQNVQYTPQQIEAFYNEVRRGRYTEAEAERIEREIFNSLKQ